MTMENSVATWRYSVVGRGSRNLQCCAAGIGPVQQAAGPRRRLRPLKFDRQP